MLKSKLPLKLKIKTIFGIVGLFTLISQITFAQESTIEFRSANLEALIAQQ